MSDLNWVCEVFRFLCRELGDAGFPQARIAPPPQPTSPALPGLVVAFSGGADSVVLAHLLTHTLPNIARARQASLPWRSVRLIHVEHGLGPHAAPMRDFCERFALAAGIDLQVCEVSVSRAARRSLEAEARRARYRALAEALAPDEVLLTAHHADDQAETVMVNLLRGSGPEGLSGIARTRAIQDGATRVLRPLLPHPRRVLRDLAEAAGLEWFEDPTNRDTQHLRNWLRAEVMPLLASRQPGLHQTLARVAELQSDYARFVAAAVRPILGEAQIPDRPYELRLAALADVEPLLVRGVLRAWLHPLLGAYPQAAEVARIIEMLRTAAPGAAPEVRVGRLRLRPYQGRLYALLPDANSTPRPDAHSRANFTPEPDANFRAKRSAASQTERPVTWSPRALPATLDLREGNLTAEMISDANNAYSSCRIPAQLLCGEAPLVVRFRAGGERLACGGHHRPLKDLLREAGIPPWRRARWPLLFHGEELVAVPGVAARADRPGDPAGSLVALSFRPRDGS